MSVSSSMSSKLDASIVLLSMIPATDSDIRPAQPKIPAQSKEELEWHEFLDSLCWLCDHRDSGKTVSSIAVQQTGNGSVFWLAGNNGASPTSVKHLKWLIQKMRDLISGTEVGNHLYDEVLTRCILISHKRVENYFERLIQLAANHQKLQSGGEMNDAVRNYITSLLECKDDNKRLCTLAFAFRKSAASTYVKKQIKKQKQSSIWGSLRHYIGRLGAWSKAVSLLMAMATSRPDLFERATVKEVPYQSTIPQQLNGNAKALEDVLCDVLPATPPIQMQKYLAAFQTWHNNNATSKYLDRMAKRQKDPCLHAELAILNHFHIKNLSFLDDRRYIGCSKPICYCCELYITLHPMHVTTRPGHGNTWNKWMLPNSNLSALQQRLLVEAMLTEIRSKIEKTLASDPSGGFAKPESTTNMSKTTTTTTHSDISEAYDVMII